VSHYANRGRYPYKNAYFILVTPSHIKIQKASELEKGKDFVYLSQCKDFETDRQIILQYIDFARNFCGIARSSFGANLDFTPPWYQTFIYVSPPNPPYGES